jgi:hypothetical protein
MIISHNTKNYAVKLFLPALLALAFLLSSCNDLPTDLGRSYINDTIVIKALTSVDTTLILRIEQYRERGHYFEYGSILIGAAGDFKAAGDLRFAELPDTLTDITIDEILSSRLFLRPSYYTFGDSLDNSLVLTLHEETQLWDSTVIWEDIFNEDGTSPFVDPHVIGIYSDKIPLQDTTDISMDIEKELVLKWLHNPSDQSVLKNIAIIPDYSNSKVIREFNTTGYSTSFAPYIEVIISRDGSSLDTVYLYSFTESYLVNSPYPDDGSLVVQGGNQLRSRVYFDLSMLHPYATIHKAQLELTLDKEKCIMGNRPSDSTMYLEYVDTVNAITKYTYASYDGGDKFYAESVSPIIEYWNRNTGGLGSISFISYGYTDQNKEMERLVFYGINHPDSSKRPKLRIIYSYDPTYNPKK